ncbi:MAG: hypothetical protein V3S69_05330 [Dehalococcoidales bacterium]
MTDLRTKSLNELPIDKGLHKTTCALFFEFKGKSSCPITPPYTLKTQDWINNDVTYKSMYLIYMGCATEYEAAIKLLGHYPHWVRLCNTTWFKETIEVWRDEVRIRDAAEATGQLKELAKEGNVTAAKAILAETKLAGKAGKPKKGGARDVSNTQKDTEDFLNSIEVK